MEKIAKIINNILQISGYISILIGQYVYLIEGDAIHSTYLIANGIAYLLISKL
jgi:hypothetical protein